jgi:5-methylcytosine-specific restriction enzyme subunit McrC
VIASDGTQIVVTPKIGVDRVLFLLGYVSDPAGWRDELVELADVSDVVAGIASLYARLCVRALHRGLLKGYRSVDADLPTVRGRIDIAEQLRRRPGLDLPLAVRYAEHDEDVIENRLLLAAAQLFRGLPVRGSGTRRSLHRVVDTLQNVSIVPYPPAAIPSVVWTRLNAHYRPAVELARLLLRHRSVDLATGRATSAGLVLDLADVFEDFVRAALREALPATEADFPSGDAVSGLTLDFRRTIRLRPDLTHWQHGRCVFVGDVKYKKDAGAGLSADLYQLLAYATGTELPEATLVYAEGPPEPRVHNILGTGVQLRIEHIDLARPPSMLLAQLDRLADSIRESVALAS